MGISNCYAPSFFVYSMEKSGVSEKDKSINTYICYACVVDVQKAPIFHIWIADSYFITIFSFSYFFGFQFNFISFILKFDHPEIPLVYMTAFGKVF